MEERIGQNNLLPESRNIVDKIDEFRSQKPDVPNNSQYGHYLVNLRNGLNAAADKDVNWSKERQREHLRLCALEAIRKFGPEMLNGFLRDELMAVLTPDDIEKIKSGLIPET